MDEWLHSTENNGYDYLFMPKSYFICKGPLVPNNYLNWCHHVITAHDNTKLKFCQTHAYPFTKAVQLLKPLTGQSLRTITKQNKIMSEFRCFHSWRHTLLKSFTPMLPQSWLCENLVKSIEVGYLLPTWINCQEAWHGWLTTFPVKCGIKFIVKLQQLHCWSLKWISNFISHLTMEKITQPC